MSLTVFGRRPTAAANALVVVKIDASKPVAALAEAFCDKLQLGVPPDAVVLALLDEHGAFLTKLIDATATLEAAGIASGAKLVVDTVPLPVAFPPLPPALIFTHESVGGERMLTTTLPRGGGKLRPFFLTVEQHDALVAFIDEAPSDVERLLMLDGTIKSGKSAVVEDVLPRMLAARYAAPAPGKRVLPRPVIFAYAFPLSGSAEDAAQHFMHALGDFARAIRVPFIVPATASESLDTFPALAKEFAQRVSDGGGEVWWLFDELQGPLLGAVDQNEATKFVLQFKQVCCIDKRSLGVTHAHHLLPLLRGERC